jgi:hypothetical protein
MQKESTTQSGANVYFFSVYIRHITSAAYSKQYLLAVVGGAAMHISSLGKHSIRGSGGMLFRSQNYAPHTL